MDENIIKKQYSEKFNEKDISDINEDKTVLILGTNKYEDRNLIKTQDLDYSSINIPDKIIYVYVQLGKRKIYI